MTPNGSRYTADIQLRGVNDAHVLGIGRIPANSRVLDLGLADGSVAAVLQRMGCRVWGVDLDEESAEQARKYCEDVVVGDLNDLDLAECFSTKFDAVLMLDILEHLAAPAAVLRRVGEVLDDRGYGVISVPNVAHVSLRVELLNGRFTYTDVGLLDRTHLRFFDRAGVDDLMADAGWQIFDLARVTRSWGTTEIPPDETHRELADSLRDDVEARTYQFVLCAAPASSTVVDDPPPMPAAAAQELVMELVGEIEQFRRVVVPGIEGRLEALRQASVDRRRQLDHVLSAVAEDTERLRRTLGQ